MLHTVRFSILTHLNYRIVHVLLKQNRIVHIDIEQNAYYQTQTNF